MNFTFQSNNGKAAYFLENGFIPDSVLKSTLLCR